MMNTANKRASAIGVTLALRLVLPMPDGVIDAADRQQVAYSYAGISAAAPVIAPAEIISIKATIRRTVTVSSTMRRRVDIKVER